MSYSGLLINRVTITRPTATYTKGRSAKAYASVATDVHCRIQYVTGEDMYPKVQGYEYASGWNGFFEYGVNIRKDDLIVDERSREFVVQSDPQDVTGMSHHVEAKLELQE
jgi:hypothetical protein